MTKPKKPKRKPDIVWQSTNNAEIQIWVKKVIDDNNVNTLYRYDTSAFGKDAAYMSMIDGELQFKHYKNDCWNDWVMPADKETEEDDEAPIKALLKAYVNSIIEKELLK